MPDLAKLSVRIDADLKSELESFVRQTGRSQQYIIQAALAEWLEDAEDLRAIEQLRGGEFVSWETLKARLEL